MTKEIRFPTELINELASSCSDSYYQSLAHDPVNISFWLPRLENASCAIVRNDRRVLSTETGDLLLPRTEIIPVPENICSLTPLECDINDERLILDFVLDKVWPVYCAMRDTTRHGVFMKNGAFSNKFDFSTAELSDSPLAIAAQFERLNYHSLLYETGGMAELALREMIDLHRDTIPTIYNGLPLHPEFRVFYDFDSHRVLYTANYWDPAYCSDAINRSASDKDAFRLAIPRLTTLYQRAHGEVQQRVELAMATVDLPGIWSVDILLEDTADPSEQNPCENRPWEQLPHWLIDLAPAERSAYWNPAVLNPSTE